MKHLHSLSYKILFSIFFFAIAGIIFSLKIGGKIQKVEATWWNSSWGYRRSITLTNSTGVSQSNVFVRVFNNYDISSLVSAGKLQSDLDDIRFVTSDTGTTLSYWIQDSTNTSVDIWVSIPSIPIIGTTIWMYYGNSSATSGKTTSLYSYSSSNQFIDDGNSFRIKFLNSGTFTSYFNITTDVFLVGGGGSGYTWYGSTGAGGGGGGYTATIHNVNITNTSYSITIGVGGNGTSGGTTTAFSNSAAGGAGGGSSSNGGAGGSGGGAHISLGGVDGANGGNWLGGPAYGGAGQGTTTREFGESSGTLYSTGGAGNPGGCSYSSGGANTGDGGMGAWWECNLYGHGGSGIVVIRSKNVSTTYSVGNEENPQTPTPTPTPPASWWNYSWRYSRGIFIANSSGVGQTYALVKIFENYDLSSLVSEDKLQSDLDDIRFVTSDAGSTISYYISDATNSSVDIWAIIPSLPTSGTSIWMYYGNSSATSVSTLPYTYTGSSSFIDDSSKKFRIKFLTSGTLSPSFNSTTIDAFLVGGGGGGGDNLSYRVNGGGGGYTATYSNLTVSRSTGYSVVIGAGGVTTNNGGSSSILGYSAAGGYAGSNSNGNGGSGGGSGANNNYGGAGGSNGSDGAGAYNTPGVGQHTTTREFGETSGDLYAGAGGGQGYDSPTHPEINYGGAGGAGGGGHGGDGGGYPATNGTTNTGGGGGGDGGTGGSGIVIIRATDTNVATLNTEEQNYNISATGLCLIEESQNDTQLIVKWQDNLAYETGFYIQKSTDSGTWTALYTADPDITNYTDTSISQNHTYQYRIAPFNDAGTADWCYTSVLNLGRGNFNFDGVNFDGVNID